MTTPEAVSNLTLDEEQSHQALLPPGSSYMEASAFMFLAEVGDYDLSFVHVLFRVGGGKDGAWVVDDTGMLQTTVVLAPKDQRGVIADNDFISNRNFAPEWSGDAAVTRHADHVLWELRGVTHRCSPPHWHFHGEHNGVEFDIEAAGIGHAVYWKGEWEGLLAKGAAGFGQPAVFRGSVRIAGKVYPIENAVGGRDNFIHTTDLVHAYHAGKLSYYWIWCIDPALRAMVYHIPGVRTHSEVNARGVDVDFHEGTTTITPEEHWIDPRTGMQVPTRWTLKMESPAGTAEIVLQGGARAVYGYLTRTGVSGHVGFLARGNGRFVSAAGDITEIVDAQSYVEWGRALFPLPSGL